VYSVSTSDKKFVNDILSDGMAEVETAKLAREHAANPDVKQSAQMMIDDHTRAGDQLTQIANTYAIPQDVKIDDKHQKLMDKLSTLNGTEFDKEYMSAMVDDHEDAVRDLHTLPTIERHLDRAKEIKDNIDHNNRNTRGTTGANDTKAKGASKY
jgi:putative membrane protein